MTFSKNYLFYLKYKFFILLNNTFIKCDSSNSIEIKTAPPHPSLLYNNTKGGDMVEVALVSGQEQGTKIHPCPLNHYLYMLNCT